MSPFSPFRICLSLLAASTFLAAAAKADEIYGPVNLLKTMATPFGPAASRLDSAGQVGVLKLPGSAALAAPPLSLKGSRQLGHRSLNERLVTARLYLPGRMVLGRPAEFIIKGKPGSHVALAMADRDSGAKPINGHPLHLGPDRKLVSLGTIDESGVLQLCIETPIEGDLIGQHLFFEAALWHSSDFSDLILATPVTSEGQEGIRNGVMVAAEAEQKRGVKIVPDTAIPLQQRGAALQGLDSGRL